LRAIAPGLVAAIYLMLYEGATLDVARRQLSFRYIHPSYNGIFNIFLMVAGTRAEKAPHCDR
jgi:hypothetical protein